MWMSFWLFTKINLPNKKCQIQLRVLSCQAGAHKVLFSIQCVHSDDPLSQVKMTAKHICSIKWASLACVLNARQTALKHLPLLMTYSSSSCLLLIKQRERCVCVRVCVNVRAWAFVLGEEETDAWVCCLHVFYDLNASVIILEPFGSHMVRGKLMTFFFLIVLHWSGFSFQFFCKEGRQENVFISMSYQKSYPPHVLSKDI